MAQEVGNHFLPQRAVKTPMDLFKQCLQLQIGSTLLADQYPFFGSNPYGQ